MMKNFWIVILAFLVLLGSWELLVYLKQSWLLILPAPSHVFMRFVEQSDRFLFHTKVTLKEMCAGFLLAFLCAFPLAWIMDLYKWARALLQPFFIITQCIPMFTLAPIMIIWFGWSFTAIVIPTALMIFFPLTMNIYQGLRSTPAEYIDYFKIHQATPWQIFFKLKLPWALPHIFGGFRLAAAVAGVAAVAGEWAGAQEGLGVLMVESRRDMDLETNFAALFCLTIISYSLYSITVGLESFVSQRKPLRVLMKNWWTQKRAAVASLLTVLIGVGLFLGGCQSQRHSDKKIQLLLDWFPNPNHIPLYVGLKKGFFADRDIHLEIYKLREACHATSYLNSGQCDLALSYMPHTMRIMHKGAEIEPIGVLINTALNGIIYTGDEIKTPQDLNGKNIGYCTGEKDTRSLKKLLEKNHINPMKTVNVDFDLVSSLAAKNIDAVYGAYWNIEVEHLRSLGIDAKFFTLEELGMPRYYELLVVAKKGSPQAEPDFVARFQEALQNSIDYSKANPEEAFAIYSAYQPDKSIKTRTWEKEAWISTLPTLADKQHISQEIWEVFKTWLQNNQLL